AVSFHSIRVERRDHVDIRLEILHRVPFLVELDRRGRTLQSRKLWIVQYELRRLQPRRASMNDEFTAQHSKVRIGLFSVSDIARAQIASIRFCVKCIARRVYSHKSRSVVDRVKQLLFSRGAHWRILVGSYFGQISCREKEHRSKCGKLARLKNSSVFRALHV